MAIAQNFPNLKPTLNLDFANTKALDPRITFTRASGATYYDGKTYAKAEENLFSYSQLLDTGPWDKNNCAVNINAEVAPDGTSTASHFIATSANVVHGVGQNVKVTLGQTYVISIYAKAGAYSNLIFVDNWNGKYAARFDVSTGTVTANSGCTGYITSIGGGWYRCYVLFTPVTYVDCTPTFTFAPSAAGGYAFAGDGTSGGYLWGAQLEQRSTITAYTPTTADPITKYQPQLLTAAAGVPRFEHDPITGESKGLLTEGQRTNVVLYSEQFETGSWGKMNGETILPDVLVSPAGTLTGKILKTSSTSNMEGTITIQPVTGFLSGQQVTYSVYLKKLTSDWVIVATARASDSTYGEFGTWVNLATGELGSDLIIATGILTSKSIVSVGNGWYRCSVSGYVPSATAYSIYTSGVIGNGSRFTKPNATRGIWGAQLETGSSPTSYIPTTTAQVTRTWDSAVISGTNFSSWYRQDEGTIYTVAIASAYPAPSTYPGVGALKGPGTTAIIGHYTHPTSKRIGYTIRTEAATQVDVDTFNTPALTSTIAAAYASNNFAVSVNSGNVSVDTSVIVPYIDKLSISAADTPWNGTIKKITYWPSRLSNPQLQQLTR